MGLVATKRVCRSDRQTKMSCVRAFFWKYWQHKKYTTNTTLSFHQLHYWTLSVSTVLRMKWLICFTHKVFRHALKSGQRRELPWRGCICENINVRRCCSGHSPEFLLPAPRCNLRIMSEWAHARTQEENLWRIHGDEWEFWSAWTKTLLSAAESSEPPAALPRCHRTLQRLSCCCERYGLEHSPAVLVLREQWTLQNVQRQFCGHCHVHV